MENKYPQIRMSQEDADWLRARAEAHHRTLTGEFSALREIVELYERAAGGELDVLPHPAGAQVVPTFTPAPCED